MSRPAVASPATEQPASAKPSTVPEPKADFYAAETQDSSGGDGGGDEGGGQGNDGDGDSHGQAGHGDGDGGGDGHGQAGHGDGDGGGEPQKPRGWVERVLESWRSYISAVGAIAATVATWDLLKDLGAGDPGSRWEQTAAVVSIVAFAFGAGLLLLVPVVLNAVNRATLQSAVEEQRRIYDKLRWRIAGWWVTLKANGKQSDARIRAPRVVGPEMLFGLSDVIDFQKEMVDALTDARSDWGAGFEVRPGVERRIEYFELQRAETQRHIAANQVARTSTKVSRMAVIGVILAVGGYGNASYIANQALRQGAINDDEREARQTLEAKVLDDALSDPQPADVFPATPVDVLVVFPDAETADAAAVGEGTIGEDCWEGRTGRAFDLVTSGQGDAAVAVLLDAASTQCDNVLVHADPSWIHPVGTEQPDSDGMEDTGGTAGGTESRDDGDATTTTAADDG